MKTELILLGIGGIYLLTRSKSLGLNKDPVAPAVPQFQGYKYDPTSETPYPIATLVQLNKEFNADPRNQLENLLKTAGYTPGANLLNPTFKSIVDTFPGGWDIIKQW